MNRTLEWARRYFQPGWRLHQYGEASLPMEVAAVARIGELEISSRLGTPRQDFARCRRTTFDVEISILSNTFDSADVGAVRLVRRAGPARWVGGDPCACLVPGFAPIGDLDSYRREYESQPLHEIMRRTDVISAAVTGGRLAVNGRSTNARVNLMSLQHVLAGGPLAPNDMLHVAGDGGWVSVLPEGDAENVDSVTIVVVDDGTLDPGWSEPFRFDPSSA